MLEESFGRLRDSSMQRLLGGPMNGQVWHFDQQVLAAGQLSIVARTTDQPLGGEIGRYVRRVVHVEMTATVFREQHPRFCEADLEIWAWEEELPMVELLLLEAVKIGVSGYAGSAATPERGAATGDDAG